MPAADPNEQPTPNGSSGIDEARIEGLARSRGLDVGSPFVGVLLERVSDGQGFTRVDECLDRLEVEDRDMSILTDGTRLALVASPDCEHEGPTHGVCRPHERPDVRLVFASVDADADVPACTGRIDVLCMGFSSHL